MNITISRTSRLLLDCLLYLATLPAAVYAGAQEVAGEVGGRENYVGKLLQTAARNGLLESRKGAGGGFRLARPAAKITLLEVVEPVEHVTGTDACILASDKCSEEHPCLLHGQWKKIRARIVDIMSRTTLGQLAHAEDAPVRRKT